MKHYKDSWKREALKLNIQPSDRVWKDVTLRMHASELSNELNTRSWLAMAAALAMVVVSGMLIFQQREKRPQPLVVEHLEVPAYCSSCFQSLHELEESYKKLNRALPDGYGELTTRSVLN